MRFPIPAIRDRPAQTDESGQRNRHVWGRTFRDGDFLRYTSAFFDGGVENRKNGIGKNRLRIDGELACNNNLPDY